ncbi:uncharacterized protein RCO7_08067 [Rhynchosporium graminicola]|uniref:Myb-like domain-containing protein n=1 Tax=Rhynchosporium graminicola TaxID=2792576 RepID=A0A1E1K742_9HELO|nr:uncharacterized protein RCO7_08067 [Rhynchosporium commune]
MAKALVPIHVTKFEEACGLPHLSQLVCAAASKNSILAVPPLHYSTVKDPPNSNHNATLNAQYWIAIMLKGRGKTFAPKKVVRKPQGSAPSSTRPFVDRPSQITAPQAQQENIQSASQKVIDLDPIVENVPPPVEAVRPQLPRHEVQQQVDTSATLDVENNARLELKRKERDHATAPPPPKRVSTAIEKPASLTAQNEPPAVLRPTQATASSTESGLATISDSPLPTEPVPSTTAVPPAEPFGEVAQTTPKVIPLNSKGNVEASPKAQAPVTRVSPEVGTLDEPSGGTANVQDKSLSNVRQPTIRTSEVNTSIPTPPASSANSVQTEPPQSGTPTPDIPIETTERDMPESSPERSPEPPRHRYPSPENIVRLADETQTESSNMGRAGGMGTENGSGSIILRPGEVTQASAIVPVGALNPDGTSGAVQAEEPPAVEGNTNKDTGKPKRKYTKRKKVQPPGDMEDARTTVGMQLNRPRRVTGKTKKGRKGKDGTKSRKERATTPDGASDEEIDQSTLTMTDLCRDLRIGKKFSRHQEIKDRIFQNKERNMKNKMIMNNPEIDGMVGPAPSGAPMGEAAVEAPGSGSGAGAGAAEAAAVSAPEKEPSPEISVEAGQGPQIRIVDGQIVLDESSLQIDRQARARAMAEVMEEVIEDDFTRVITSGTYMKREKSMLWDHAATIRFYEGLAQFGTDFEMIAKLFPHRNRRQIKLKFNKEERAHPERVTRAMVGPKKKNIDLKNFERLADEKLVEVSVIEAEYDEYENEMLAKEKVELDAAAEITRQKKAAIQGTSAAARKLLATVSDDEDDPRAGSAKENRGKTQSEQPKRRPPKKTAKKNKHSHYAGGDVVTVLETISY